MARISKKQDLSSAQTEPLAAQPYRAALYARLSVEDNGRDSDSVESQLLLLRSFAAQRPWLTAAAEYTDNGFTGTDFHRPGFQAMMDAVRAGEINCILVKDLSRLGRDYIESGEYIEKIFPFYKLRFISVNDSFDTETASESGQLSASLANVINDCYARDISRKVTSALKTKMERGDYIGHYAPHGYRKDPANKNRLLPDPETAPVIRQIFEWRAEGMSYMGINRRLNEAGIPSPGRYRLEHGIRTNNNQKARPLLWNKHVVSDILRNPVYIGELVQRRESQCLYSGTPYHHCSPAEQIVAHDCHEALVTRALFDAVQERGRLEAAAVDARYGRYDSLPKAKNLYGDKFRCAGCGAVIKLCRSISRDGKKAYFTYKCPTFAEHGALGCTKRRIGRDALDEAVFTLIKQQMALFIDAQGDLERLGAVKQAQTPRAEKQRQLAELRQTLARKRGLVGLMYRDLKSGVLSAEEYVQNREILSAEIADLEKALAALESACSKADAQADSLRQLRSLVDRYRRAPRLTAELADAFVERILLGEDGSLEIRLKYADEFAAVCAAGAGSLEEAAS